MCGATGTRPTGKGIPIEDTWNCSDGDRLDSLMIKSFAKKTGYPTEKTLELYERIVRASSKRGEVVLDPFCGCATTCVAAEKKGRRWVGIDIWDKAHEVVIERLKRGGDATRPDGNERASLSFGDIHYTAELQNAQTAARQPHAISRLSRHASCRWSHGRGFTGANRGGTRPGTEPDGGA